MGILDKIGDVIGDVVDGVVDFVDDVFNIDLRKVLSNDIVKYGLMAASIFTGGIAIANGVMQGFGAATAAKGFMGKFVAGASEFVKGVGAGLANPLETAGNMGVPGFDAFGAAAPGASGNAVNSLNAPSDASGIVDSLNGTSDIVEMGVGGQGINAQTAGQLNAVNAVPDTLGGMSANDQMLSSASDALSMDPSANAQAAMGGGNASAATGPSTGASLNMPDFSAPVSTAADVAKTGSEQGGFFSNLASGAKDWATSAGGMQTLAGMASGWAEGQMIQEKWDNMIAEDRRREASWANVQSSPRSFARTPTLQSMREERESFRRRGDQAQAKYGY